MLVKLAHDLVANNLAKNNVLPRPKGNTITKKRKALRTQQRIAQACTDSFFNGAMIAMKLIEKEGIEKFKEAWDKLIPESKAEHNEVEDSGRRASECETYDTEGNDVKH